MKNVTGIATPMASSETRNVSMKRASSGKEWHWKSARPVGQSGSTGRSENWAVMSAQLPSKPRQGPAPGGQAPPSGPASRMLRISAQQFTAFSWYIQMFWAGKVSQSERKENAAWRHRRTMQRQHSTTVMSTKNFCQRL